MPCSTGPAAPVPARNGDPGFFTDLYLSGTTFFTLGIGDVVPRTAVARFLVVIESGMGFGFLALVIAYLTGVRPMVETFPLEQAAKAYGQMIANKARFRLVLTMG